MTDRKGCGREFDTPLAVRVGEVSGFSLGKIADLRKGVGDLFPLRVADVDEVEVQGTESFVSPYADAGPANEHYVDPLLREGLYDECGCFGPVELAEWFAHCGFPVRRGRLRCSVNDACKSVGRRPMALFSSAFNSSVNA